MTELESLLERIESFPQSPVMVAASQAHESLCAANRASQAVRDAAAAQLGEIRASLVALQGDLRAGAGAPAAGEATAIRLRSLGLARSELRWAQREISQAGQSDDTGQQTLLALSRAAEALRALG